MAADPTTRWDWRQLVRMVLARDNYQCQIRGPRCTHVATTGDHITPRTEGGALLDPANVRAACRTCNSRGGATITNGRRRAFTYRIPSAPTHTRSAS